MKGPLEKLVLSRVKGFIKDANGNEKLTATCILQLKSSTHSSILFSLNGNANTYTCSSFLDIKQEDFFFKILQINPDCKTEKNKIK